MVLLAGEQVSLAIFLRQESSYFVHVSLINLMKTVLKQLILLNPPDDDSTRIRFW